MPVPTITWEGGLDGRAKLVDQTLLPTEFEFIYCDDIETMWEAIKVLRVRGAPAIGIAAGFGTVLGVRNSTATTAADFMRDLKKATDYLATSRPTAVNLFWALKRMLAAAKSHAGKTVAELKALLLQEALAILEEDRAICRRIGQAGADLIKSGDSILTHCNAGGLATGDYGTALAVMFAAHEQGKRIHVFADETRPLLQGARLTAWELKHAGIDVTVICDNMAGLVMRERRVDCVIVGADRIAANGDAANKIGTYSVSVLAKEHRVPFYVAAPVSTFDLTLATGDRIPIEERDPKEVTHGFGRQTAPDGVNVYNPAFDVTPACNIAAIITENGLIHNPTKARVAQVVGR